MNLLMKQRKTSGSSRPVEKETPGVRDETEKQPSKTVGKNTPEVHMSTGEEGLQGGGEKWMILREARGHAEGTITTDQENSAPFEGKKEQISQRWGTAKKGPLGESSRNGA